MSDLAGILDSCLYNGNDVAENRISSTAGGDLLSSTLTQSGIIPPTTTTQSNGNAETIDDLQVGRFRAI